MSDDALKQIDEMLELEARLTAVEAMVERRKRMLWHLKQYRELHFIRENLRMKFFAAVVKCRCLIYQETHK